MFLILVKPYKGKFDNYLNIFNELSSMLVVYFILQINGNSYFVDQKIFIGLIVVRGIYISAFCNLIVIIAVALFETR